MKVDFSSIKVGSEWTRPELAKLWGYRSHEAICRGVITPSGENRIILFITGEKQKGSAEYEDVLTGDILKIEGETNHAADRRLIAAGDCGDEIHLFIGHDIIRHSFIMAKWTSKVIRYTQTNPAGSRFGFVSDLVWEKHN